MKTSPLDNTIIGEWEGTSHLWRNWLPEKQTSSVSQLTVAPVAKGKFLSFAYTWSLEGEEHGGFLLVVNETNTKKASGSWGDSWHQSASLLVLSGRVDISGHLFLSGTFEVPSEPDWGWRITVAQKSSDELQLSMYVIPWNGTEELAVQADYVRVGGN